MEPKTWAIRIHNNKRIFLTDPETAAALEETITASNVKDILDFAEKRHIKLQSAKIQTEQFSTMLEIAYWIKSYESNPLTIIKRTKSEFTIEIHF